MAIHKVKSINNNVKVENVLISVSDKTGLDAFVKKLLDINEELRIFSTGGTYAYIENILGENQKKNLFQVAEYTKQPELDGGLVKTLDFKIYLGLLSEDFNTSHQNDLQRLKAINFDMVVVNLYPFSAVIQQDKATLEDARSHIDIGGPTMLRASAKNFLRVASVSDPGLYSDVLQHLEDNKGNTTINFRLKLSKVAFQKSFEYESSISQYLSNIDETTALDIYTWSGNE